MAREKIQASAKEFIDKLNGLGILDDDGQPVTVTKGTVSKLVNGQGMPLVGATFTDTMRWLADNTDPTKPKSKLGAAAAKWLAGQGGGAALAPAVKSPPAARRTSSPPAQESPTVHLPEEGSTVLDRNPTRTDSQREKSRWDAEMKKREVLKHDREHIAKSEVTAVVGEILSLLKAGVMGIAGRVANKLEGKTAAERYQIIQDECRTVLDEAARRMEEAAARSFEDGDSGPDEDGADDEPEE